MSQTKPKWLLTALVVVAILGLSVAGYAAPPPDPTIIGPTTAEPVAVKQGNNVYVTFDYISQPTEAGTTRAEIVIRKGATIIGTRQVAFPLLPDTGEKASFTAAVPINTPVAEGTYNIRLQISNHDGLSGNINELDAVLVDNTPPGNVPNFGPIISGAAGPTLTWIEPADAGTPASGIGWYEVSIDDGVNPAVIFSDVSAVDPDPVTPGFQWTVPAEFADGNYTVKVWARDKAYNKSTAEGTGILIVDTTKPVLDQQGPVGYVNNALPTLTARFRDLGLGVSGYRHPFNTTATPPDAFKLDNGDISPDSEPAAGAATGIITKSIAGPLAQGNHTVALTLHDRADNEASLEWEFFVDTVLPSKPATVTAPDPITSDTPAFYWEPGVDNGDPQSGVAGYTVQIWTTGSGAAMVRGPYTVTDD
ncbi:MAG: hypothetical protein KA002_02400, partial [Firmicutes bacterium]|nr:hypothetical protein [Bacillota bacterium]